MRSWILLLVTLLTAKEVLASPIRPALNRLFSQDEANILWDRFQTEPGFVIEMLRTRMEEIGIPEHPPGFWDSVLEHLDRWEAEHPDPPIPEPGTAMLLGAGLVGLAACGRCNRKGTTRLTRIGTRVKAWCLRCGKTRIDREETLDV